MARVTRSDLFTQDATDLGPAILEASAPLATGVNKDGTPFYLPTEYKPDLSTTANLTAVNQAATLATQPGYGTVAFHLTGTFVGTVAFEVTLDGTTWFPIIGVKTDGTGAVTTSGSPGYYESALPAGVTQARIRCGTFTSGTIVATVSVSPETYEPGVYVVGGNVGINASSNAIGRVTADAMWWAEVPTSTLAPSGTWSGVARDCWGVGSGAVALSPATRAGRFRVHAAADQTFLLIADCSDDGVTWDPVAQVAQASIGGVNVAYLDVPAVSRFMRGRIFNNSASAFTFARARTSAHTAT